MPAQDYLFPVRKRAKNAPTPLPLSLAVQSPPLTTGCSAIAILFISYTTQQYGYRSSSISNPDQPASGNGYDSGVLIYVGNFSVYSLTTSWSVACHTRTIVTIVELHV